MDGDGEWEGGENRDWGDGGGVEWVVYWSSNSECSDGCDYGFS